MNHHDLAHLDAGYVLGALGPEERQAFEEHLRACRACEDSVASLRDLPRLLGHVDESLFLSGMHTPPVPDTLLPALLREVRTRRRRHRWALAAAAAVVVAAAGGAVVWTQVSGPEVPGAQVPDGAAVAPVPMDQVGQDVLRAGLAMEEVPWGTRLELTCTYDAAGAVYRETAPPSYSLAVLTRDGEWEQVATWRAVPGRTVTVAAATAAGVDDITSVEVRSSSGRALLELDS